MFANKCEVITHCELVAESGARYSIELVAGNLHKYGRDGEGREIKIACSHGVRVGGEVDGHEYNFATRREACDFFGRMVGEKLHAGYRFLP